MFFSVCLYIVYDWIINITERQTDRQTDGQTTWPCCSVVQCRRATCVVSRPTVVRRSLAVCAGTVDSRADSSSATSRHLLITTSVHVTSWRHSPSSVARLSSCQSTAEPSSRRHVRTDITRLPLPNWLTTNCIDPQLLTTYPIITASPSRRKVYSETVQIPAKAFLSIANINCHTYYFAAR